MNVLVKRLPLGNHLNPPTHTNSMKTKHVFTDIDGTKYFQAANGDIVNRFGELVSLTEEYNVLAHLRTMKRNQDRRERHQAYKDLGMVRVRGSMGGTYYDQGE